MTETEPKNGKRASLLRRLSQPVDLTAGTPWRVILRYAVPIMISYLLQQIYVLTDAVICGQVLSAEEVAGVNDTFPLTFIFLQFAFGCTAGFSVLTAGCVGAGDRRGVRRSFAAQIHLSLGISVVLTVLSVVLLPWMLELIHVTPINKTVYDAAYIYCLVIFLGIFAQMGYNFICGILRSFGDSVTPLVFLVFSTLLNVGLDILFLVPFRMGPAGAAIATVSSQILVFVVMVLRIRHSRLEPNVLQHLNLLSVFPKEYYKHIFRIGFPTAIQGSIYCFISMILTRMVSGYGAAAIATQRVGGQIESVSWNTADGFASALNAFIAQNYGARKKDRIRKGYSLSFRVLTIWGLFVTAAFVFLPEPIARLFFHEKEALDTAVNYLVIIGFSEVFMSIELMTVGALSGLGRTRLSSTISVILTGSRIPLALILTHAGMGLNGVWWALTISSIVKGIVFTLTFRHISRRLPEERSYSNPLK